ncbi:MAG TPA: ribosomal RNA small subunit methyltransferase A [Myxococcales bacterium]|nr:ribosomal RNA small subunit methyltransferase A [Myxococcales bacterium]
MSATPGELLRKYRLRPKKDWGQNFLGDERFLGRIAATCGIGPGDTVVELGAGLGHLTRRLAETGARVVAVERDRDLVAVLEKELALPNVELVAANAAAVDFAALSGVERPVVAGNLPYQLSSSILFEVLDQRAHVRRAVFLLQKEVAQRIASGPGSRDYGLLSVLLQAYADVELAFEVPAGVFLPPPKVDSAVVRIDLHEQPRVQIADHARFVQLVKAAFAHRRKVLLNTLKSDKSLGGPERIAAALEAAGVDPKERAENLSPAQFAAIERALG